MIWMLNLTAEQHEPQALLSEGRYYTIVATPTSCIHAGKGKQAEAHQLFTLSYNTLHCQRLFHKVYLSTLVFFVKLCDYM